MKEKGLFRISLGIFGKSVLAGVMCLLVSISLTMILSNKFGIFLSQALCLIIYCSLPYTGLWTMGDSDCNKVNFGHKSEDRLLGLKAGCIAGIPGLLISILPILAKAGAIPEAYLILYRFITPVFMPLYQILLPSTLTLAEIGWIPVIISSLQWILLPLISWIGYEMGYYRIAIMEKFVYVNPDKKNKKRRA